MESKLVIAGIDVHKRMLAVVLVDADNPQKELERRRFATGTRALDACAAWLESQGVNEAVLESTAQYWNPVWLALEGKFLLHLPQAQSNGAPRGRKSDFVDALRLARRFLAAELKLSFVPDEEQRGWRCLARSKYQLRSQQVRLHGQIEALLEESRIKLSSMVSDLLGATGRRILGALVKGETNAEKLAALAANNVKASREELADALRGPMQPAHRKGLGMWLAIGTGEGGDECGEIGRISREQCQSESGRTRRCAAGTHAARAPEGAGDVVGARGADRPADRGSSSRTG